MLELRHIHKYFAIERGMFKKKSGTVRALEDVSFKVEEFDTLGIVGESGSGKTTLAKIILRLIPPTQGEIIFDTKKIENFRKDVQIVFQNPYNSLNPKMRIINIIKEPLFIHRIVPKEYLKDKAVELLKMVGLDEHALERYPNEFSGGQRQRICLARALATNPKFVVLDEPISSLDLTVQAQILDLFLKLKEEFKLTYVFISHNLAVIRHIAEKVIVMQNGRIVEENEIDRLFNQPRHPYTRTLLAAATA